MNITELQAILQNLKINITAREIAEIWGMNEQSFSKKKKLQTQIKYKNLKQLEDALNIKLISNKKQLKEENSTNNCLKISFNSNKKEYFYLDERLFEKQNLISNKKTNTNNLEIITVSGNSMSPEYKDGDRVIIDKSVDFFVDGHIFAFKYNGKCFMKEICLTGKKVKAIPLNKEYEPFFIEPNEEVKILGQIIPRVRL